MPTFPSPPFSSLEDLLHQKGPCLSTALCEALVNQGGLTAEAARQRISRARPPVTRLAGLVFPKGARFLYLETDSQSDSYWKALVRDIGHASPAYRAALAALQAREGIAPLRHFCVLSGAPRLQKGQIASKQVLERLRNVGLIKDHEIPGIGACIEIHAKGCLGTPATAARLKARLVTESILLLAIKEWVRKVGFGSYDCVQLRDEGPEPPQVGTFHWDLTAPSYLGPLVRWKMTGEPLPGFFVCDVVCGTTIDKPAMEAFVRKYATYARVQNKAPVLAMFVADHFDPEAVKLGRSNGLLIATPSQLFGVEVASGLGGLLQTLTRAAEVAIRNPLVIGELLEKLGRIEGAARNLRGPLFELLVSHCVKHNDDGSIEIGRQVRDTETGKDAEIDVLRIKEHREIWAYECKAHEPGIEVTVSAIDHWITDRLPLIYRYFRQDTRFSGCQVHFEYWTSGGFSEEALSRLKEASQQTKRYSIGWKDGKEVRSEVAKVRPTGIAKVYDEHFFRHPLSSLA